MNQPNFTLQLLGAGGHWEGGEKKQHQRTAPESDTRVQEKEKQQGTFCPTAARLRKFQGMGQGTGKDTLPFSRSQGVERFRCIRLNYNYYDTKNESFSTVYGQQSIIRYSHWKFDGGWERLRLFSWGTALKKYIMSMCLKLLRKYFLSHKESNT